MKPERYSAWRAWFAWRPVRLSTLGKDGYWHPARKWAWFRYVRRNDRGGLFAEACGTKHEYFLSIEQDLVFRNMEAVAAQVPGDYTIICGHCGESLCGMVGRGQPKRLVMWRNEGAFFGSFTIFDDSPQSPGEQHE